MKNEGERLSKDKGKISVLKKKLSSSDNTSEDSEKKLKKGKKIKKTDEENVKLGKTSSFVRKFNFGKYLSSPTDMSRASSSKSMSESENSDRLSSGYSTLTPTSIKRHKIEEGDDKSSEETFSFDIPPQIEGGESLSTWSSDKVASEFVSTKSDANKDVETILMESDTEKREQSYVDKGKEEEEAEKFESPKDDSIVSEAMPAFGNLIMDMTKERPDNTSNISQPGERKEHLYKILVIGELGTGKTSIIKRYVHQFFSQHYRATIGVDFALKVLNWDANTIIRLQLWDIAGQERFGNMTRVYYKDAVGAFIVFDVTRVATFDAVDKWKQDLDSKVQLPDGSSIPCVLLGNKCDQQKEGIVNTPSRMDEYCKEKGFSGWFETSAKENVNIEEAALFLVNKILLNDKLLQSNDLNKDTDRIAIDDKGNANGFNSKSSKTCSC